jgi:hypothetical protein
MIGPAGPSRGGVEPGSAGSSGRFLQVTSGDSMILLLRIVNRTPIPLSSCGFLHVLEALLLLGQLRLSPLYFLLLFFLPLVPLHAARDAVARCKMN